MDNDSNISNVQSGISQPTLNAQNISFRPKPLYNDVSPIHAFGFKYSYKDYEDWQKNRIYNVSKEIQYKAIINSINTSLPQYIMYYYFQNLGFECEYSLKENVQQDNLEKKLNYTLDLYDPVHRIDIEYDGKEYHKQQIKDIERDNRVLTEPSYDNPIARKVIRIREGNTLYNGKNNYVNEFKIEQYNQGFNEGYAKIIKEIYDYLIRTYGQFENHYIPLKIDPIADEIKIRLSYFEYAEETISKKGEQIFDYYPFKDICRLYNNAGKEIPQYIIQKHRDFTIRTAYNYDTRYLIDAVNVEYQKGDDFYSLLHKLENKYDTLKRAELCDANRLVIQGTVSLLLYCHKYNNQTLINDLLSLKMDRKASKSLILSDTHMQLLFAKEYKGTETPFYEDVRFKLMNYRKNEEGQICPDANVVLFHKIKYEEEEWALWHEIQSFAKEFKISSLDAMFKKIMINKDKGEIKNISLKYFDHFFGISQNNKLDFNKSRQNFNTEDIFTTLYENKADVCEFMRNRSDLYGNTYENKTDDEIFGKIRESFLKEKNDDRYKTKGEVNQKMSIATAFGVSSLAVLFKSATDSNELNKILNSYNVKVSPFKTALAHDYIMKRDYNFDTHQFAAILKRHPDLFPDMANLTIQEIHEKIVPDLMNKNQWYKLIPPYFTNTQEKQITENMKKVKAFDDIRQEREKVRKKIAQKYRDARSENKEGWNKNYNYSKNAKYNQLSKDIQFSSSGSTTKPKVNEKDKEKEER